MPGVTITFSSSNGTVGNIAPLTATTGTAGTATTTFTAGNPGSATVKAANGLISGTATVTVNAQTPVLPAPVLRSITLTPATTNLNTTKTQVFTATALDQNGAVMPGVTITFSSSNGTVGNIAPLTATTGTAGTATTTFTAGNPGSATVKAANGLISGTATVTVNGQISVPPPTTGKATVKFVVTDSRSHRPIHEADVSFGGKTKETNDYGMVKFTDVVPGTYNYKVSKEGYQTIKNSIKVTGDTTTIYVKMVKTTSRDSKSHD